MSEKRHWGEGPEGPKCHKNFPCFENSAIVHRDGLTKQQPSGHLGLPHDSCSTGPPSQGAPPCFAVILTDLLLCLVPRGCDEAWWHVSEHDPQSCQVFQTQGTGQGWELQCRLTRSKATPPLVGQTPSPSLEENLPFSHFRLLVAVPPPVSYTHLTLPTKRIV